MAEAIRSGPWCFCGCAVSCDLDLTGICTGLVGVVGRVRAAVVFGGLGDGETLASASRYPDTAMVVLLEVVLRVGELVGGRPSFLDEGAGDERWVADGEVAE